MSQREFDAYLRLLGGLLRLAPQQREQIAGELRDHMEERLEALLAAGVPREEAIGQALEEFGDVAALAASFQQIAWNRKRRWMMRCTAASVCGMLVVILAATAFWPGNQPGPGAPSLAIAQDNDPGVAEEPRMQTPEERNAATRVKLEQMTVGEFPGVSLDGFFATLEQMHKVEFYVDTAELQINGIDMDTSTVTIDLSKVRANMLLDLVLDPIDCGYYLRDGIVCITSKDKAMTMAELRVYDCERILAAVSVRKTSDVVGGLGGSTGGGGSSSSSSDKKTSYITTSTNADTLIKIITSTVDPESWETVGGLGSIAEYDGKLVVRQTDAAHAQIRYLLDNLGQQSGVVQGSAGNVDRYSSSTDPYARGVPGGSGSSSSDRYGTSGDNAADAAKDHGGGK